MSSTNKTTNYQLSQFVGADIPSILNDYNGDMRKIDSAVKEVANAGGNNATAVAELQATVGQHTTEIGGINSTVNSLSGRVLGIEDKIPANASASNKLITAQDIPEIPSITGLEQSVATLQSTVDNISGDVTNIKKVIPSSASATNKLVTSDDLDVIDDIDNAIATIEKHRYRKLYTHDSGTILEDANAIWNAFKAKLSIVNLDSIINNLPNLIIYDGRYYYRCNEAADGGSTILNFTCVNGFGTGLYMYTLSFRFGNDFYRDTTIISVEGAELDITASGITSDEYTPIKLNAYLAGGTYAPRHLD